jgi:choline dehydrogenase-like flavoprotein
MNMRPREEKPAAIFTPEDFQGVREHQDSCDVVIIGTGCAGAAAARVLAEAGLDTIMVEEGRWFSPHERPSDTWTAFKMYWRDAGFQVARGRTMMPMLQGRAVGGSTVVNGAIVHRLPRPIYDTWVSDYGVGKTLSWDRLQTIFDTLDQELHVAPGPENILGRNNLLMKKGADAMGVRSNIILRNVVGCEATARCLQGCPGARKQSMDRSFIPYALQRGARVYSGAEAQRVTNESGRATGVLARLLGPEGKPTGTTLRIQARKGVIIAASAIQSPLLLAASGIGKQSGQVGRRLQAHPGSGLIGVFEDPVHIWKGATQGFEVTHWWDEKMKFETVGVPPEVGLSRLPGFGPDLMKRAAEFGHIVQWGAQVRAEAKGRVKKGLLGGTSITYDQTNADIAVLKKGLKRVATMMFEAGAQRIYPGIHGLPEEISSPAAMDGLDHLPDDPRLFHGIASHMFGTALMGADSQRTVVGDDGQCHELPGLYVADSSIFPTNMGVNPAHTISAIAWHIAQRIAETQA